MGRKRYDLTVREHRHIALVLSNPDIIIDTKNYINPEILREAVKETITFFPLYQGRFVLDNSLYILEENTNEPVVFHADNCPDYYGGTETNFFPWVVLYREKTLIVKVSHAVTDGMGAMSFAVALLHIYLEKCGVVFSDAAKVDLPQEPVERLIENPDECYADRDVIPIGYPKFGTLNKLDPDLFYKDPTAKYAWKITLKEDEIKKLSKASETTTSSTIAFLLGRSMARAFNLNDGNVEVRVPVNYRPHFSSPTQHNFSQSASLRYLCKKMSNMSRESIQTAFRSQLDIYLDKDNMKHLLSQNLQAMERLQKDPGLYRAFITEANPPVPLSSIVYSHLTFSGFSGELLEHIADVRVEHPCNYWKMMVVFAVNFGGEIRLCIHHQIKNNAIVTELEKLLTQNGIHFTTEKINLEKAVMLKDICGYAGDLYGEIM